jgi:signal transduction histidine kinase
MRGALCFCLLALASDFSEAQTLELTTARAAESAAARPREVDFSGAAVVALPDNWRRTRRDGAAVVWYEAPLDAALKELAGRGPLALVVPRVAEEGDFWLNGERLEVGAGFGTTRNRALWFDLPPSAFRPSGNALQVRVAGQPGVRNGLSAIRFGPAAELRLGYETRRFLQTSLPFSVMFLVGVAMFAAIPLWLKTRRRSHLLFMLLCALWLPRTAVIAGPATALPASNAGWLAVILVSLAGTALLAILGIEYLEGAGRFWQRLRRAVTACAVLSALAAVAWSFAAPVTPSTLSLVHWPLFAMLVVITAGHLRAALIAPRPASAFTAGALALWALTGFHDLAQVQDWTDFDSFFWSPAAIFPVFLALIWRTVEGLALERGRADEEVRHAVTRERAVVVAEERERLLHDLHDGMGGQLITALRMTRRDEVPREEVARVIEGSLEDMRLIIDSLDLDERDLLPLLANLRYRLEPRLNAIGLELRWEVEPLPELDWLTPETGLAVVRIVQEAVNNAVRHAAARTLTVSARPGADSIEIAVADDGQGFDTARIAELATVHRGLGAMRTRARKLGGELSVESSPGRTRIALTLPLRR